jgi:hypothetical protein
VGIWLGEMLKSDMPIGGDEWKVERESQPIAKLTGDDTFGQCAFRLLAGRHERRDEDCCFFSRHGPCVAECVTACAVLVGGCDQQSCCYLFSCYDSCG